MDVIEMEIVLVLNIHILCECAVEIECRGGCLSCKGGVIEGYHLYVILPAQLTINRPKVNVIVNVRVIVKVTVIVITSATLHLGAEVMRSCPLACLVKTMTSRLMECK